MLEDLDKFLNFCEGSGSPHGLIQMIEPVKRQFGCDLNRGSIPLPPPHC